MRMESPATLEPSDTGSERRIRLMLIEDERGFREGLEQVLDLAGFDVHSFASPDGAIEALAATLPEVVLTDLRLPGMDGLAVLERCRRLDAELPVILMTAHGDIPTAVEAIRNGAYDFLEKPFSRDRLVTVLRRAAGQRQLALENQSLRSRLASATGLDEMLCGGSARIRDLRDRIVRVAPTPADVLVSGETGTGKEMVARALHACSGRTGNFVAVNCAAIPEALVESELFGHEAGAFTGANKRRLGKFEHAKGGTLFLDEIQAMPLAMQAKLLRVLQEREIEPLGGNRVVRVEFRVVAATNAELERQVQEGLFRADLFYRLNVVRLWLPALRDRREDIPLLFQRFIHLAAMRYQLPEAELSASVREQLVAHAWPGNVRELKSAAERLVLGMEPIGGDREPMQSGEARALNPALEAFERLLIEDALRRRHGNVSQACDDLQINQATLYRKLKAHGLDAEQYRPRMAAAADLRAAEDASRPAIRR